jgi:two-component system sensor histidine kinase YesM
VRILQSIYKIIDNIINGSIKNRIILFFSLLIVISLCFLGFFSYDESSKILTDETVRNTNNLVEQTVTNINAYFEDIKSTIIYIAMNQINVDRVKDFPNESWTNGYDEQNRELDLVNGILKVKSNIFDILILSNTGQKDNANLNENISPQYNFFKQKWLADVMRKNSHHVEFISLHPQDYYAPSEYNSINDGAKTVSAAILMDPSLIQGKTALVMCDFELKNLDSLIQSLKVQNGGNVCLIDDKGKIIFSTEIEMINKNIDSNEYNLIFNNNFGTVTRKTNKGSELLIYSTIKACDWKVAATIPMNNIYGKSKNIRDVTFRTVSVSILLVLLLSIIISTGITKPLYRLIDYMKHAEEGQLDIKVIKVGYGEIAVLERQFKGMLERINTLIKDVYQTRLKQKDAEYAALQSQINPHFLYNTLQMIKAEAVINDDEIVSQMITSLGYLLRYAIYNKHEMVLIQDEVEYVKNYLYIFKKRFEERIGFKLSLEDDTLKCKIPKLILQPVIENSITHGLSGICEAGEINIAIKFINNKCDVLIEVYDNGCGIEENKLQRIINELNAGGDERSIGLKNVQERIRMKFGEAYGINIESKPSEYTCVKICIPALKES